MTRLNDQISIHQMLQYSRKILEFVEDTDYDQASANEVLQLALFKLFENIGEAANRVSDETRLQHPQVPWRELVDFRNFLIHGYDAVEFSIVWQVIEVDLEPLIRELERITRT